MLYVQVKWTGCCVFKIEEWTGFMLKIKKWTGCCVFKIKEWTGCCVFKIRMDRMLCVQD